MKILFANYQDNYGTGGYRVAYRLYQKLRQTGVSCNYLVRNKMSGDESVIAVQPDIRNKIQYKLSSLIFNRIFQKTISSIETSWSPNIFSESKRHILFQLDPDVVHLHWICGDFISIENLREIQKPIVWTMHDMWALTGGCHYSSDCNRYKESCGLCPQLKSRITSDLSRKLHHKKRRAYEAIRNMTIISPSRWMAEKAKESSLMSGRTVQVIPNGIDDAIFKNPGKSTARDVLNIPKDKIIILFTGIAATSDPRKGFQYLLPAIQKLTRKMNNLEIVVLGGPESSQGEDFGCKANFKGILYDELSLSLVYSAADVTVVSSTDENLSTVIMESLSCGTPVVAFNIGGNGDLVEHQRNGYLATPFESDDLARGIEWVVSNPDRQKALSLRARGTIEEEFSLDIIAKKHIALYQDIISRGDQCNG